MHFQPRPHRGFFVVLAPMKAFGFGKAERLKSRKIIDALFANRKSIAYFPLRVKYGFAARRGMESKPVQAGVSVPKKAFKRAVDRNRLKRQLREAYRLQKGNLIQIAEAKGLQVHLFFMYTDKAPAPFAVIYTAMTTCLLQLEQKARTYHENAD